MPARTYESLAHAAERAEVSVKTLRRRIASGELRAYRCGSKLLRVDPNDVDRLMNPLFGGSRRRRAPRAAEWVSGNGQSMMAASTDVSATHVAAAPNA